MGSSNRGSLGRACSMLISWLKSDGEFSRRSKREYRSPPALCGSFCQARPQGQVDSPPKKNPRRPPKVGWGERSAWVRWWTCVPFAPLKNQLEHFARDLILMSWVLCFLIRGRKGTAMILQRSKSSFVRSHRQLHACF